MVAIAHPCLFPEESIHEASWSDSSNRRLLSPKPVTRSPPIDSRSPRLVVGSVYRSCYLPGSIHEACLPIYSFHSRLDDAGKESSWSDKVNSLPAVP